MLRTNASDNQVARMLVALHKRDINRSERACDFGAGVAIVYMSLPTIHSHFPAFKMTQILSTALITPYVPMPFDWVFDLSPLLLRIHPALVFPRVPTNPTAINLLR